MPTYHLLIIYLDTQVLLPRDLWSNKVNIVMRSDIVGFWLNALW